MYQHPSSNQPYTRNPEEVLKELSKKWSESQSQANSQFTFRPPSDLQRGPELQEIRLESNITSPLQFFSTVDGYGARLDSPKASFKLQETLKFTNEFSNGIVNRTLKAVEDAQVISEGRNMQIELELSGLKLFDLEKKVDSCLSSSRTVLSLNSRLSPNVSTVLSQSATKDKLARLQQEYTKVTRGFCSISPQKSSSQNIKISTSMMDSINLQELTICMSPQEREKLLTVDKKLNETKTSCTISPVALAAKKYLENKENPYDFSANRKSSVSTDAKAGGIATVRKPGALGRPVESQSSPIQRSASPIESAEYNSNNPLQNPREAQVRQDRFMSVSTGSEEKSADTAVHSHPALGVAHNRWISSANDSRHKNEEESGSRVLNGEISFREEKVEKSLFREQFEVSPVLKALSDESNNITRENLIEKANAMSQPGSQAHLSDNRAEKPKTQLPPLKTFTLGALDTQGTDNSIPTGGRLAARDMKGDIGGSSSEMEKRNSHCGMISNDSDQKMLESLSEVWKTKEESSQEKKKYTDKPRQNIRHERSRENLTRQNNSSENLHKSAKKSPEERKVQLNEDSVEEYMIKSGYGNTHREWKEDSSSIRVESEPSHNIENSVEKQIHDFLNKFGSEKERSQAREWLKKVIDGDKNSHTKSLEVLLQGEQRRKTTDSSNTNNSQSEHSNSAQKRQSMQRASSSNKIQKGPIQTQTKDAKKKEVAAVYSLYKGNTGQKSVGAGVKDVAKKECKSHSVINEPMDLKEKAKASSMNGFTRKKLDSSSTSGLSNDEAKKINDRMAKTESLRNMAKNLEYLEFLRKDVVRSINYIEKSIQDLGDNNDTSLEGKSR